MKSTIKLRGHHIERAIMGYSDRYSEMKQSLQTSLRWDEENHRSVNNYSPEDVMAIIGFYRQLITDPTQMVEVVNGTDTICELCSNYDRGKCALYTDDELKTEDTNSLRDLGILPLDGPVPLHYFMPWLKQK